MQFSLRFWCGYLHQPKNITTIPYHFISTLLNSNFDFDVSVANDVAIDVAKCALPSKVMQWSPCPEVCTLTNENQCYIMKLNDWHLNQYGDVNVTNLVVRFSDIIKYAFLKQNKFIPVSL